MYRAVFGFRITQRVTQQVLQQQRDAGRVDIRVYVAVRDIDFDAIHIPREIVLQQLFDQFSHVDTGARKIGVS